MNGAMGRPGGAFSILVGLAFALGILMYVMGKSGKDLSLHVFDGRGATAAEALVAGFVHRIDAARRSLTVRESPPRTSGYRTVLLTPATEFMLVSRAQGIEALDHPNRERRIRPDDVRLDDYVVVAVTPMGEGLRAASVTVVHSAPG